MTSRDRRRIAAAIIVGLGIASRGVAQVSPDVEWRTLRTLHFQVHFSPGLEAHARRAAVNAERAWTQLAAELVPPRGPVDLVIADNVDFTNGYATPFPTNRIVVYASPPVATSSLRFYDEWSALVITHELTHIFHLDRARGWWRFAQRIFGRSPPLMPNLYTPSWLTEGLAVYYESRLTGAGRLVGTEHGMIARAAVIGGGAPSLTDVSLATSRYPEGQSAYAYGSLVIDYLARTRGPAHVGEFVERISRAPVPFLLGRASRRSFGVSLDQAWREFQDSVRRGLPPLRPPMPSWRELTTEGRDALYPRWIDDQRLVYTASTGKETPGAYTVGLDGRGRRVGRRNGLEPNVPLADGSLLFAQLEFIDPYRVRSDLYIATGGDERRLTRDARLSHPDARDDGAIVAAQALPGTTRLVRVSADGRSITALTSTAADTQWAEPRWSPDGTRIAAVRRGLDGFSEIVVLDTAGVVRALIARSRSVEATPAWTADGSSIVFSSDRSGSTQLYIAPVMPTPGVIPDAASLTQVATGISQPAPAPHAALLAAVAFEMDGYHVGVAPLDLTAITRLMGEVERARAGAAPATGGAVRNAATAGPAPLGPATSDTTPARPYSPWRTLLPRYWLPTLQRMDDGQLALGGYTSGEDVITRHAYSAQAVVSLGSGNIDGGVSYRYARLGNPILGLSFSQFSDYFQVRSSTALLDFRERTQVVGVSATMRRPRYRSASSFALGAELERTTYSARPAALLPLPSQFDSREYAAVVASADWANTQRPALSISPEDGFAISASARQRWKRGAARSTVIVGSARGYKALDLGGFAHHVVAARVAGAYASASSTTEFGIGGTSGSSFELFPGYSVGDSPRTFGVRGFPGGTREGLRAVGGSVEYRAPLGTPSRGLRFLPVFFDKLSATAFADAAAAWCPGARVDLFVCPNRPEDSDWLASAGAELNLDAALPYDVPYRFRLGVAAPLTERVTTRVDPVSIYFTLGFSF